MTLVTFQLWNFTTFIAFIWLCIICFFLKEFSYLSLFLSRGLSPEFLLHQICCYPLLLFITSWFLLWFLIFQILINISFSILSFHNLSTNCESDYVTHVCPAHRIYTHSWLSLLYLYPLVSSVTCNQLFGIAYILC